MDYTIQTIDTSKPVLYALHTVTCTQTHTHITHTLVCVQAVGVWVHARVLHGTFSLFKAPLAYYTLDLSLPGYRPRIALSHVLSCSRVSVIVLFSTVPELSLV